MKKVYLIIYSVFCYIYGFAQPGCEGTSLGRVYELIKKIDYSKRESVSYRSYSSFDFKHFKPSDRDSSKIMRFKIGVNDKGEIREIQRINWQTKVKYRLKVFDFQDCRILIPADENGKDGYYQTAILMDKRTENNFLVSSAVKLGEHAGTIFMVSGGADIGGVENISTLTILDSELYPIKTLKVLDGRVVFSCDINYRDDHRVDYSEGYFFPSKELHENLIITAKSCPKTLAENCVRPEMLLKLKLSSFGNQVEPLWDIFGEL